MALAQGGLVVFWLFLLMFSFGCFVEVFLWSSLSMFFFVCFVGVCLWLFWSMFVFLVLSWCIFPLCPDEFSGLSMHCCIGRIGAQLVLPLLVALVPVPSGFRGEIQR